MTRINITDDMIERAYDALHVNERVLLHTKDEVRMALEAALDRRTGPKDRRVEWDDLVKKHSRRRTHSCGRRDYDTVFWTTLPRTSHRLKREAEAKAQEISGQCFNIGDDAWIHTGGKNNPLVRGKVVHIFSLPGWACRHHYVVEIDTPVDPILYVRDDSSMSDDANKPVGIWRRAAEAHAVYLQEMKERGQ